MTRSTLAQDLRAVSDRFLEAALEPECWPDILSDLSVLMGGRGALMFAEDSRLPGLPSSPELIPVNEDYFKNGWNLIDDRYRGADRVKRFGIASEHDYISEQEIRQSPFYQDFLRKHDCPWAVGVGFRSGDEVWCISIQRSRKGGPFDDNEKECLRELIAPLSDTAALARKLGLVKAQGFLDGLQIAGQAAAILDWAGRVLAFNALGEQAFGPIVDVRDRSLRFGTARGQTAWATYLNRKAALDSPGGGPDPGISLIGPDGRTLMLRAIVLAGSPDRIVPHTLLANARFLVLWEPGAADDAHAGDGVQTYGLTAAESQLVNTLVQGLSLIESANLLGITYHTARSRLKEVFTKTDTHRQSELVARFIRAGGGPAIRPRHGRELAGLSPQR